MAYSKTPTMDTYSSDRVSLFREIVLRDGGASGKDEDYINVFMEPIKQTKAGDQRKFIVKRAGTSFVNASVATSPVRGLHYWADQNKLYYCVGRNVYVYNVLLATTTTLTNVFVSTTGNVGFCEFLYEDGTIKIVATDGTAVSGLVTIDNANTVVTCADADLPAHQPYPVFLDGYIFVAATGTANIYNSVLNDPLSWNLAFITAEMEADLIVRIAKINNYLLVFGKESVEYFWDAGNPDPYSPLQRNDTPIKINSYLAGFAIYGNAVYYIGVNAGGQPDVFVLKDFKMDGAGSPSISRYLGTAGDTIADWHGVIASYQGHTFYIINAGSSKTWALDVDTGLITRLAYQQQPIFDIKYCTNVVSTTTSKSFFCLDGNSSAIYKFDDTVYQDTGTNFTSTIITEASDFGTLNRKSMHRMSFIGDRPAADSNLQVYWSDDDYVTYHGPVDVNMNQDLPCVRQLGSFRQRIFKFTYTDNYPMRFMDVEVDINKGKN